MMQLTFWLLGSKTRLLRATTAVVLGIALASCNAGSETAMAILSKRDIVVLASGGVDLSEKPVTLHPLKPIAISGSLSSICFVLEDGVRMQDMSAIDRAFSKAIGKARIRGALVLSNGYRVVFDSPSASWSEEGIVLKAGELAACAVPQCGPTLPVGAAISEVEASSVPAISVKGIYWKSERDPSEPLSPSLATKNVQAISSTGCSPSQDSR